MKRAGIPPQDGRRVSASVLAQMGVCEKRVVFEQRYGRRRTLAQLEALQRGLRAHQRFFHDGHLVPGGHQRRLSRSAALRPGHRVVSALSALLVYLTMVVRIAWRRIRGVAESWSRALGQNDGK